MSQQDAAEAAKAIRISDAEIAAYHRDGAVLLKGVLDPGEVALLTEGLEEIHNQPSERFTSVKTSGGQGGTLADQFPCLASPSLSALLKQGRIARIASTIMRTQTAQLVLDQVFYKESGEVVATPWHQDTPYLRVRGYDLCRVWLTCDSSPRDLTVQIVRGSHRWNVVYDTRMDAEASVVTSGEGGKLSYTGMGDDRLPPVPDVERYRDSFDILGWDVEPGDAVVFHGNVLHGASGVSSHPRPRRAFASMWAGPGVHYHLPKGESFPGLGEMDGAQVPEGARIGDYPDAFPVY